MKEFIIIWFNGMELCQAKLSAFDIQQVITNNIYSLPGCYANNIISIVQQPINKGIQS